MFDAKTHTQYIYIFITLIQSNMSLWLNLCVVSRSMMWSTTLLASNPVLMMTSLRWLTLVFSCPARWEQYIHWTVATSFSTLTLTVCSGFWRQISLDFRLLNRTYLLIVGVLGFFSVNELSLLCVEFKSCGSKYAFLALCYYSSQKCCLGGVKLWEGGRQGGSETVDFADRKVLWQVNH